MKTKEIRNQIDKAFALEKFPWLLSYFQEDQLLEIYVEVPDQDFYRSRPDDLFHLESIFLLDCRGEQLCEVGADFRVLSEEVWRANPETRLHVSTESVSEAFDRLGEEKAKDVVYLLLIQNTDTAFIFMGKNAKDLLQR